MANEELKVRLTADDQLTSKVKTAAAAVKDLDGTDAKVKVTADTSSVERDIDGLVAKVDQLAQHPAELLLTSNAVAIEGDIAELVLKMDTLDDPHEIRVTADQLNSLTGDLDRVTGKLKEVSGTRVDIDTSGARRGVDDLGKSADSSKSVLANMVGNATQDLGALGGVAGSAGVAIGQMGEYMADAAGQGDKLGQIIRGFGGIAVPLAAVAVATQAISGHFEAIAEDEKVAEAQARRFAKSLDEGASAAQVLRDELESIGKLEFRVQIEGLDIDVGDITGPLARAGLDLEGFVALSKLSNEEFRKWADGAEAAGVASKDLAAISLGLAANYQQQAAAATIAANNEKVLGTAMTEREAVLAATIAQGQRASALNEEAAQHVAALNQAYADSSTDSFAASQELAADAVERVNGVLLEQADALKAQNAAAISAADANLALADMQDDLIRTFNDTKEAEAELIEARKQHGPASAEAAAATNTLNDAFTKERDVMIDVAHQAVAAAEATAEAGGASLSATGSVDAFNTSLVNNAHFASPQATAAVFDYLIQVNQIPAEKATDIIAAVAAGDLETAKRLLDEASATRAAAIIADANTAAAENELQRLTATRTVMINARLNPTYGSALGPIGRPRAGGGTVGPSEWAGVAGEAGAEFVRYPGGRQALLTEATLVPSGTQVTSVRRTREILSRRGLPRYANGGTVTVPVTVPVPVTVNVNAAVIGNPFEVDRAVTKALRRFQRFNGMRP